MELNLKSVKSFPDPTYDSLYLPSADFTVCTRLGVLAYNYFNMRKNRSNSAIIRLHRDK